MRGTTIWDAPLEVYHLSGTQKTHFQGMNMAMKMVVDTVKQWQSLEFQCSSKAT